MSWSRVLLLCEKGLELTNGYLVSLLSRALKFADVLSLLNVVVNASFKSRQVGTC